MVWALAVWIKPHFLAVAACWWAFTLPRLVGSLAVGLGWRAWLRVAFADLGGSLLGGGAVGAIGVWYLVTSGTWDAFREVMTTWSAGYLDGTLSQIHARLAIFIWFPPWNFLAPLAVVFALFGMIDARVWAGRFRPPEDGGLLDPVAFRGVWFKGGTDEERYARACLGAVYILWLAQGVLLQRSYLYVHAAEVFIGLGVWAAYRWNASALILAWLVAVQVAWVSAPQTLGAWAERDATVREVFTPHPIFDRRRLNLWWDCVRPLPTNERWRLADDLRWETHNAACFSHVELHEVAEYLRSQHVGDGELVCWHDSPHALYLLLGVKPGLRFMHVNTARMISEDCDRRVCEEFAANLAKRFVVIDLKRFAFQETTWEAQAAYNEPGVSVTDLLPPAAQWVRNTRNWRMPAEPTLPFDTTRTVFRGANGRGRYVVIELKE
jgi:hypothetical protein